MTLEIKPRFDVYREFESPDRAVVVATGVQNGQLRTLAVSVRDGTDYSATSEDEILRNVRPMLEEWWAEPLNGA